MGNLSAVASGSKDDNNNIDGTVVNNSSPVKVHEVGDYIEHADDMESNKKIREALIVALKDTEVATVLAEHVALKIRES